MPSVRDPYLIGKLGSYDVATLVKLDAHLRTLRAQLTTDMTPRRRISTWADVNALLERRHAMATTKEPV